MPNDPFVDVAALLSLGPIRYLDARDQEAFDAGHAPGAVRVPVEEWDAAAKTADIGFNKTAYWDEALASLGVDSSAVAVTYDGGQMTNAARVWFILQYFGIKAVILNGGWPSLSAASRLPPGAGPSKRVFRAVPGAGCVGLIDRAILKQQLGAEAHVFDTRTRAEFTGEDMRNRARGGHLPGARHLSHTDLLDNGVVRPASALRSMLEGIGFGDAKLCARLIAYDRATLIAHPIGEAEVVHPDIVKPGAHGCGSGQCRSSAPFAMSDDVITGAEAYAFQRASEHRRRTNNAVVEQISVRQVPGAGEMPPASAVAHVLAGELCARTGVEYMRIGAKLPFEGLPIDQTHRPGTRNRPKNAFRGPGTRRRSSRRGKRGPAAIQYDSLDAEILKDKPNSSGVGHLAAIIGHGGCRRIDPERPKGVVPVSGLVKSDVGRLGRGIPFFDRHAHSTGRVAGIERRLITRIEIADWTQRRQCSDIDEGIVQHGGISCESWGRRRRLLRGMPPAVPPGYWIGISSSRPPGPATA